MSGKDIPRLDEIDKEEWWDVWRSFKGDDREAFEKRWAEFATLKAERERRKNLN